MCAIPAKVAGVKRIVAISPPLRNGKIDALTLVSADICGVDEVYKVGGAHGIMALAFGTPSISKVSNRDADAHRPAAGLAGDRHQPAHALRDLVDAGARRVRAALAEARDRAVDDCGLIFATVS